MEVLGEGAGLGEPRGELRRVGEVDLGALTHGSLQGRESAGALSATREPSGGPDVAAAVDTKSTRGRDKAITFPR